MGERAEAAERDRVAGHAIVRVGLAILGILVFSLAALGWLARYYREVHPQSSDVYPIPTTPRIDPAPQRERDRYLAEQRARLQSYAWVDREKGLAHVPIERAMGLYAQRARKGGAP